MGADNRSQKPPVQAWMEEGAGNRTPLPSFHARDRPTFMSEHKAKIVWTRGDRAFNYETYSRDHVVRFGSEAVLEVSAAPAYKGSPNLANPEEMLVAALASCHMLTFLAIAVRQKVVVEQYDDDAVGYLEKNAQGRLAVTRVVLRPRVRFAPDTLLDDAALAAMHDKAHHNCFIANSVTTEISIETS